MKKLNNKGMSLMELLVSIVLISIVLTFLFQLLTDLKNETTNNDFAYNNQINRAEIIKTIKSDLEKNSLIGISDNTADNIKISFHYLNGKTSILSTKKENYKNELGEDDIRYLISYTNVLGEKTSWTIKGGDIGNCYDFVFYKDSLTNNYHFKLNIYVYNNPYHEKNSEKINNPVDDIEITYANNSINLSNDSNYLTIDENSNKKINICTK